MELSLDTPEKMVRRKNDHIKLCLNYDVESKTQSFEKDSFLPEAMPHFDLNEVDTRQNFLGRTFALPLFITGMTGGVEKGQFINEVLAEAAQEFNVPMGLGSQKMQIADPSAAKLFDVKSKYPKVFLIGNLGLSCFNYGVKIDDVKRLIERTRLDAFAFHLNAVQEAIQGEGETNFSHLLSHLDRVCRELDIPVIVKEVGSGMTGQTALRLSETGVSAIDVGGNSGTSWGLIEGLRGQDVEKRLGYLFRDWGLSTRDSLVDVMNVFKTQKNADLPRKHSEAGVLMSGLPQISATGGIRSGLDVAKAVARGATMAGVGLPFFKAVMDQDQKVHGRGEGSQVSVSELDAAALASDRLRIEMKFFERSLRLALFASGSKNLASLGERIS